MFGGGVYGKGFAAKVAADENVAPAATLTPQQNAKAKTKATRAPAGTFAVDKKFVEVQKQLAES